MKLMMTGIVAVVLCGFCLAQDPTSETPITNQPAQPSSQPDSGSLKIAPGSVIPVQLSKSVDAKKAKSGDNVEAKVTQDLKAENGQLVVPKDTKIVGHVTEAQVRNKDQKESQIGIAFDHAVTKDGRDVPLPLSIQAIIAPAALNTGRNDGGAENQDAQSTASTGGYPGGNRGRGAGMSGEPASTSVAGGESPAGATASSGGSNANQPITGNTQGVVGISNLKLETAGSTAQGSVVSSEKSNVKLESGTLLLLRVN
jgi:hypothetical protein